MLESLIFLFCLALLAALLCWLMERFPRSIKLIASLGMLVLAVLSECSLYTPVYEIAGEYYEVYRPWAPPYNPLAILLWLVVTVAVLSLMGGTLWGRVRQRCGTWGTRLLLISGFSLLPLHVALYMDASIPFFGEPLTMWFSQLVAGAVLLLLLWQAGVLALAAHLSRYGQSPRHAGRHTPCRP